VEYLSLDEVAQKLHLSRRRIQALVERGQLPAHRVGGRWLVEATQVNQRRRVAARRGRPLTSSTAWQLLTNATMPDIEAKQDAFRRLVHTRAEHREGYVHPSALEELRKNSHYIHGGRAAAADAGLPVGEGETIDLYLQPQDINVILDEHIVRFDSNKPNLYLHIVNPDSWPFTPEQRFTPLLVAWLDLADRGDRAERLVREQLSREKHD
jgi:excisionase family DNA binding protein